MEISCMTGLYTLSMPWWVSKPIRFMTGVFPAFLNGKYLKRINGNAVVYATFIVCKGCTQKQRHLHLSHAMTLIYGNQLHYRLLHCTNCLIDILTSQTLWQLLPSAVWKASTLHKQHHRRRQSTRAPEKTHSKQYCGDYTTSKAW